MATVLKILVCTKCNEAVDTLGCKYGCPADTEPRTKQNTVIRVFRREDTYLRTEEYAPGVFPVSATPEMPEDMKAD